MRAVDTALHARFRLNPDARIPAERGVYVSLLQVLYG